MDTIELGDLVQDTVSGFFGIAVAETRWLNDSCLRIMVQPLATEAVTLPETESFPDLQLEVISRCQLIPKGRHHARLGEFRDVEQ